MTEQLSPDYVTVILRPNVFKDEVSTSTIHFDYLCNEDPTTCSMKGIKYEGIEFTDFVKHIKEFDTGLMSQLISHVLGLSNRMAPRSH